jgi:hypothetical protein
MRRSKIYRRFRTRQCLASPLERLLALADQLKVFRVSDVKKYQIHHQVLRRAFDRRSFRSHLPGEKPAATHVRVRLGSNQITSDGRLAFAFGSALARVK